MMRWLIVVLLSLVLGAAWAAEPIWSDGFEHGALADYLQVPAPAGVSLQKAGQDGSVALRMAAGTKSEVVLREFAVQPGTKYRLEFVAKVDGPEAAGAMLPGWEIRVYNTAGQLPFAGHLKSDWQCCHPGAWSRYRQRFYTPGDAAKVQVRFVNPGGKYALTVDDVKLEPAAEENLLISGESFAGLYDYAGWSEVSKAGIVEVDGKFLLRINAGGYALTDPIPVTPGEYRLTGKKPNATAFFYDVDMRRIGIGNWANAKITVPEGGAFMQLFYGAGDIESLAVTRAPEVKK